MLKKNVVLFLHALVGWGLCGATMGLGMAYTSIDNAVIIHAAAAPVIYFLLSSLYFRRFNYTTPIKTAAFFLGVVIFLDVFVVALLIEKSFDMFRSPLGTWIPFALIFGSTYLTGRLTLARRSDAGRSGDSATNNRIAP